MHPAGILRLLCGSCIVGTCPVWTLLDAEWILCWRHASYVTSPWMLWQSCRCRVDSKGVGEFCSHLLETRKEKMNDLAMWRTLALLCHVLAGTKSTWTLKICLSCYLTEYGGIIRVQELWNVFCFQTDRALIFVKNNLQSGTEYRKDLSVSLYWTAAHLLTVPLFKTAITAESTSLQKSLYSLKDFYFMQLALATVETANYPWV